MDVRGYAQHRHSAWAGDGDDVGHSDASVLDPDGCFPLVGCDVCRVCMDGLRGEVTVVEGDRGVLEDDASGRITKDDRDLLNG